MGDRTYREIGANSHNARVKTKKSPSFFVNHLVSGKVTWQRLVYGKLNATRMGVRSTLRGRIYARTFRSFSVCFSTNNQLCIKMSPTYDLSIGFILLTSAFSDAETYRTFTIISATD